MTQFNFYWDCVQGIRQGKAASEKDFRSFEEVERIFYQRMFSGFVEGQNARNEKNRHSERNRTVEDLLKAKRNSVIVIEHNLRVLLAADWIIDLGPEGGKRGGNLIAAGTPKHIMEKKASATGKALCDYLSES